MAIEAEAGMGEDRRPAAVRAFIFRHPHRPEHGEES